MTDKGNFGNINLDMLAEAVALRLAGNHDEGQVSPAAKGGGEATPAPPHHGKIVHLDPRARARRVRFDEDELALALSSRGLACATRKVRDAPVEVKLIMALLLNVGLSFEALDGADRQAQCGFDNPLVEDARIEAIASRFGVGRERLGAEIANAPSEMLAVLLVAIDLCIGDDCLLKGSAAGFDGTGDAA
ncbi:MAG: hypothetical protein IJ111_10460 [Eggerthellaceae bacterium]|nr:hypothetical protein [Eggerthellaceae bacterium]